MNKRANTYNAKEDVLRNEKMTGAFKTEIDERTGEQCLVGYDNKNKMKVTLLFQEESKEQVGTMVTNVLVQNFINRLKKQLE